MRVALLTSAAGWRGSAASYAKIARGLGDRGHRAHLVTASARLTARFREENLPVSEIPGRNTGIREVQALWRTLRGVEAQVVVVDTPRDVRLAALATLLHRAPIVYRYNLNYRRPRNDLADRLYVRRVSACIYQSRFIEEDASRQAPWVARVKGYRIANGYDTDRFAPRPTAGVAFRERWDISPDIPMVLTSAKLARNKGHDIALQALDRVRRSGQDLVYVICGDGARESELRSMAAAFRLPVRFTGLLGVDDVVAGLNAADLVLHPSEQEIFPNAVGEAMACGRPIVAANAGGTAELLGTDGSAGVLVPPGDPAAMAAAVCALTPNASRRSGLGAAARRRIQTEFPLSRMIDGYEAALDRVIQR
jgi:glycosyltransferase involved in cell wall biosynthesis